MITYIFVDQLSNSLIATPADKKHSCSRIKVKWTSPRVVAVNFRFCCVCSLPKLYCMATQSKVIIAVLGRIFNKPSECMYRAECVVTSYILAKRTMDSSTQHNTLLMHHMHPLLLSNTSIPRSTLSKCGKAFCRLPP